ncbi:MAG TPA: hypothetical protein VKT99_20700 [Xanthobacteraceae bacterium]|jgi:hypothetical protein|nr:hypothetical protein [Xanthobacteraceae bacterium]
MKRQALFFGIFAATTLTLPALAADGAAGITGVRWGKNAFNFEPMPSGPQPLRNLRRRPDGTGNAGQLVGDYNNPILTPEAAMVVKQKGELAIAGKGFANAQDQCRPIAPPFAFAMQLGFEILPAADGNIAILYDQNMNVRHIRMSGAHPANLAPSPMGDSVGHWEGDVLVIDTVGIKTDAFTSVDRFGTPQSEAMHVVERYRLIDGALAKAQIDKYETSEGTVGGGGRVAGYNPDTSLKGLQLEVTMEDPKVFTAPLTARVTYRRLISEWQESVCADNPVEHYKDEWVGLPKADHPDF